MTALLVMLLGCAPEPAEAVYPLPLPEGFPAPPVPADNPISVEKVELGRHLFYDRRLSGNGEQSCGDCHDQSTAFSDGLALPLGSTGDVIPRNSMTLTNAAWWSTYTWMNPTVRTLEEQALVPMFAEHPIELGMTGHTDEILARLREDSTYQRLFRAAYPTEADPFQITPIVNAIASFERALVSGNSAYDRYWYGGDESAMTDEEIAGMNLFFSETAECYHCHAGVMFSTAFVTAEQLNAEPSFNNNGLYNLGGTGDYPSPNVGLYEFTLEDADKGKFRVPTLRNIAVTAPYFHDGSAATLEDVLAHYMAGGRLTPDGPAAGDGRAHPSKSIFVREFQLTLAEQNALLAFLRALTDEDFLSDPAFAPP
jgi:cytochrome c peroxidase